MPSYRVGNVAGKARRYLLSTAENQLSWRMSAGRRERGFQSIKTKRGACAGCSCRGDIRSLGCERVYSVNLYLNFASLAFDI